MFSSNRRSRHVSNARTGDIAWDSTVSGERFQVRLMNPYAGEAVVDLIIQSESALEAASHHGDLGSPRSSAVVDLAGLSARETVAVNRHRGGERQCSGQGSRFDAGADGALGIRWRRRPIGTCLPAGGSMASLVISTGVAAEMTFRWLRHLRCPGRHRGLPRGRGAEPGERRMSGWLRWDSKVRRR